MVLSENDPGYRQCSISVMDNIADPNITFDDKGICNYYHEYRRAEGSFAFDDVEVAQRLNKAVLTVKDSGRRAESMIAF